MPGFERQAAAYSKFSEWMTEAQVLEGIFRAANLPVPPPLLAVVGDDEGQPAGGAAGQLPVPDEVPAEFKRHWIWIQIDDATPTTLVLGLLNAMGKPVQASSLADVVLKMRPGVNRGTIMNIGTRLDGGVIRRSDAGWELAGEGPILTDHYAWGPASLFTRQEVAAHRRLWICHLLEQQGGLLASQIESALERLDTGLPVSKDLVKMDLEALRSASKICRIGNSRKWRLAGRSEGEA